MSIEFGQVNHAEPENELRPDRNAQFASCIVGEIRPSDLPIFVDLDVMRDMEAHSQTNTQVELGGVMLGRQRVDANGAPFVVVQESLRAEHYHATKGSFTFTHDTWSEITRRRAEFHPDLEMVGWYHTHPGWNVFLSGMDTFICDNFFNRILDVALVIDPCNDDRGWFQWDRKQHADGTQSQTTRRTSGFILYTGRHRAQELEYFANLYSKENKMNDPRYSNTPARETIQLIQPPQTHRDTLLIGMLVMQLIMMIAIVYWMASSRPDPAVQQAGLEKDQQQTIHQQAQAELVERVVAGHAGNGQLASEFTRLKEQEYLLRSSLDGQLARLEKETLLRKQAENDFQKSSEINQKLLADLDKTKSQLTLASQQIDAAKGDATGSDQPTSNNDWILWLAGGLGLLGTGGALGYFQARRVLSHEQIDEYDDGAAESVEHTESTSAPVEFSEPPVATH